MAESRKTETVLFIVGAMALGVLTAVITLAVAALAPAVAGWRPAVVTSGSMSPSVRTGDVVVARPAGDKPLRPGTVVMFDTGGGDLVTHRVISVNEDGTYTTKGDANQHADSTPVPAESISGTGALAVPWVGRPFVAAIEGNWRNLALLLGAAVVLTLLSRNALDPSRDPWAPALATPSGDDIWPAWTAPRSSGRAAFAVASCVIVAAATLAEPARAAMTSITTNSNEIESAGTFGCAAPSVTYVTGYEHGPEGGPGLYDRRGNGGGTPVYDGAVSRSGRYALKVPKSSGFLATSYVDHSASGSVVVLRFGLYLDSAPAANVSQLAGVLVSAGNRLDLRYDSSTAKLAVAFGSQTQTSFTTVTPGAWHLIDMRVDVSANPRTVDWRVNGVDQPDLDSVEAATTVTYTRFGSDVSADAFTARYDDALRSSGPRDYPFGNGRVLALRPTAMAAGSGQSNFTDDDGTAVDSSSYSRLDDDPMNSTVDYVTQTTASTASYIGLAFGDTTATCIRGVNAIVAYNSSSFSSNNGKTSIFDGTTERVVHAGNMAGAYEFRYRVAVITPAASAWTTAAVNGLVARVGYSSDVSPAPRWDSLIVEYESAA